MKGWVYVITDPAKPGLVKIGFTASDPELRAKELDGTASPMPHAVAYATWVSDPRALEQRTHEHLSAVNVGKEWFRCAVEHAVQSIRRLGASSLLYEHRRRRGAVQFG